MATETIAPVSPLPSSGALHTVRSVLNGFYAALMALSALAMVSCFVAVMVGIADRQFGFGLRGLDAYSGYAIAAALFLAMPGTLQRGEHIRVTLVLQRLPERARAAFEWVSLVAGALLCMGLAWYACRLVWVSRATNDVSAASDATPLWLPQLAMAMGCVGLAVALLDACMRRLRGADFYRAGGDAAAHVE